MDGEKSRDASAAVEERACWIGCRSQPAARVLESTAPQIPALWYSPVHQLCRARRSRETRHIISELATSLGHTPARPCYIGGRPLRGEKTLRKYLICKPDADVMLRQCSTSATSFCAIATRTDCNDCGTGL